MGFLKNDIDFMSKRHITTVISAAAVLISLISLAVNSLQWGLDFTSGTMMEVGYEQTADVAAIRDTLVDAGHELAVVQPFGSDRVVLIRVPFPEGMDERDAGTVGDNILELLQAQSETPVELRSSEFVSPTVGEELAEKGGLGLLVAFGMIMVYVAMRFQFKFSVGAVVALVHDVIIILGVFSLFHLTFDLTVMAAVLAVIGYSINDTIVVADRIRENFRTLRSGTATEIINISLNQVLSRTVVTSFTTFLVVLSMLVAGGEVIRGFATAMAIGLVVGTYSSVYIASNILIYMGVSKEDLMVSVKEGAELDSMP